MISVRDLQESIYQNSYFSEKPHSMRVLNEVRSSSSPILRYVDLQSNGSFIQIENALLKDSANIFQTADKVHGRISFRRDCDGIGILDVNGRHVLLLVEVKSNFNLIKETGIEQLVSSYVKMQNILHTIKEYNPNDYEEMGILFSYPPHARRVISSSDILAAKTHFVAPSYVDTINSKYATALRMDHEITIDLQDYNVFACHVNSSLFNPTLKVKHIDVTYAASSAVINLDALI